MDAVDLLWLGFAIMVYVVGLFHGAAFEGWRRRRRNLHHVLRELAKSEPTPIKVKDFQQWRDRLAKR